MDRRRPGRLLARTATLTGGSAPAVQTLGRGALLALAGERDRATAIWSSQEGSLLLWLLLLSLWSSLILFLTRRRLRELRTQRPHPDAAKAALSAFRHAVGSRRGSRSRSEERFFGRRAVCASIPLRSPDTRQRASRPFGTGLPASGSRIAANVNSPEIAARSAAWTSAFQANDLDALLSFYATDARMMPPGAPMTTGHEGVRAVLTPMFEAGLTGDLASIEAMSAGDIGYNVGKYTLRAPDGTLVDEGKFIETWKLVDGEWMLMNDIFNSSLAPPAEEADGEDM